MRRLALPLAALVVLAACSGDSGGDALTLPETTTTELPVQTVATTEAPPVTEVVTTQATTTSSTTTSSTTTIEDVPLTVLEPATTVIPADVDETFAEAFAVYQEAWALRRSGAEDPTSESVRDGIDRYYVDAAKTELIANLDEQAAGPFRSVDIPSRDPSSVMFVEAVATVENGTFVEFQSCEVITSIAIDTTTDEVSFDTILAYAVDVRMRKIDGEWFVSELANISRTEGRECER